MKIIIFNKRPKSLTYTFASLLILALIISVNVLYFSDLNTSINTSSNRGSPAKLAIILDGPGRDSVMGYMLPSGRHLSLSSAPALSAFDQGPSNKNFEVIDSMPKEDILINTGGKSAAYIKSQLDKAMDIAFRTGTAVVLINVDDDHGQNTVSALYEMLPEIDSKNIQLVYLSELSK
ncbi:MAG: divergent polysaccharide deacetylase family protein [Clostridiales bacterium]|jgi:polysaccharide deacetylase 2 family uncharacterized protein YibQ|nr:divergent polysaccharide deacetylase family protein [Eubacteriales bacterium]MDH7565342.1 divergent polysaccharide deacetylase family protein [Clostridiales bacterium]